MPTNDERLKIMKMVQDGKITAEEAIILLEALEGGKKESVKDESQTRPSGPGKWFRVKVSDTNSGKPRANIRLPISLVSAGIKMGAKFSPELDGMDMNILRDAINNNRTGMVLDVFDDQDGEHVEIFIEE